MANQDEKAIDQALVERAVQGDQKAFRQLVERYQRKVYTIAFGVVRNPDTALDITQDAFVRVHKNLATFKGDSSFYTWIYRIVLNLCIDRKRRQARQAEVDYDDGISHGDGFTDGPTLASTGIDNPAQAAHRKELVEHMDRALATLSEEHKAILLMREVDGLSYEELAETLDIPKGTVMSRLFHARKNFQKSLTRYLKQ
ncbi:MAG TPA: sigma-70 family RNA polymerase sigma factor [Myxococcota bacterium]|nr:sigma-70 family RNA polymerase sigma factor [Myxococcota bacterium]